MEGKKQTMNLHTPVKEAELGGKSKVKLSRFLEFVNRTIGIFF